MGKKIMNKLIVDKELDISDYEGNISFALSENVLNIKGKCRLYDFNNINNITINLLDNSSLEYYKIRSELSDSKLLVNQSNDTYLDYKEVIINNNDFTYEINTILNGNNNVSKVTLRCLNESGSAKIFANGRVEENTSNNELLEDLRGLNLNDNTLVIKPDMQINSLDVIANHKVTISNVKDDELFYLESKGVNRKDAIKLLKEGFILGILPLEMQEKIKEYIK